MILGEKIKINFFIILYKLITNRFCKSRRLNMRSKGILILGITWIVLSICWFWLGNTALSIIWLCAGIAELTIGLIIHNKEKKQ